MQDAVDRLGIVRAFHRGDRILSQKGGRFQRHLPILVARSDVRMRSGEPPRKNLPLVLCH